ncbi:hypothetical protein P8610_19550 [Fictibacillus sp. UD]|uniref:hypothetical protein n=1 Tax=Fictibacillus sp. UD TaxID=3038777 RepID=UPI00374685E4
MKQTRQDFLIHLKEQVYFLKRSCEGFDRGYSAEGKSLASTIRTLVHDTSSSISLLTHLDCKKKIYYFNTAIPGTPFGLVGRTTTTENGGKTFFSAPLDNLSDVRKQMPWITFDEWWINMVALSDGRNNFSRKDLILRVANQDGGSHVDKKLNKSYAELSRGNSLNVYHQYNSGQVSNVHGPELASVRQIAFELLKSLQQRFDNYFQ